VCGLVLLCAVLGPLARLDISGGQQWLDDYFLQLNLREKELEGQVNEQMKIIIERQYAAYIVDKAAEMGLSCTARVTCRVGEDGLFVPDTTEVALFCTDQEQSRLTQDIAQQLGVPMQRQTYYSEEELP
jgi:stage III sporulation protein AF